ncbi:putative RDD family membrane protein YckC [Aeromicrobium panaciterrae]|uniref:RDD family membrane protein YckC n=1 Tax=Aeromicrobium panaciterrae TaxID=363861 RepID=A0ABU1UL60_9ACTN|nr:RDD family protein [Aeromicrobium panaciterrae]MDR7085890.1 putative RDD family membrane protein YckC [Aeromicrobium panaciterrae]
MTQPPENQQPDPSYPTYPSYPGAPPEGGFPPPPPQYGAYPPPPGQYGYPTGQVRFASWLERFGALILDSLPGVAISFAAAAIFGEPFTVTVDSADQLHFESDSTAILASYGLGFLWIIFNSIYLQGTTGQTIGKKVLGIAVYRAGTNQPTGYGLAIGRYFARFLDLLPCYLGVLWPLWDNEKRTFADMICGTRVYKIN